MKKEEDKDDGEFQRVQPVIRIEKRKNLFSNKIESLVETDEKEEK